MNECLQLLTDDKTMFLQNFQDDDFAFRGNIYKKCDYKIIPGLIRITLPNTGDKNGIDDRFRNAIFNAWERDNKTGKYYARKYRTTRCVFDEDCANFIVVRLQSPHNPV